MTGHFKVNGVGTLWLAGNDEVMAKEVGSVMIVWELWHGTVTREVFMERDEMIFVVGEQNYAMIYPYFYRTF